MRVSDNRKKMSAARVQKNCLPSDRQIQQGFELLFLSQSGTPQYTSAREFALRFKRCTLFDESAITTTAHAGV